MKKLSSRYGKHLSMINNNHNQDQFSSNNTSNKTNNSNYSAQVYNQTNFGTCDIIGNYDSAFIVVHSMGRLYLIDQHAASQKSLYVQFLKSNQLFPVKYISQQQQPIQIQNIYLSTLQQQYSILKQLGWDYNIITYGPIMFTLQLVSVPSLIGKTSSPSDFLDVLQSIYAATVSESQQLYTSSQQQVSQKTGTTNRQPLLNMQDCYSHGQKESLASTACHTAYRSGHLLSHQQMRGLLDSLQLMDAAFNCPHGRPIIVGMGSIEQLTKGLTTTDSYDLL